MDTYPRLAKELDLAWTPDRSRIVAYDISSGNVVATLTVKEGLFLSQLDGDVDPDDVGEFTQLHEVAYQGQAGNMCQH